MKPKANRLCITNLSSHFKCAIEALRCTSVIHSPIVNGPTESAQGVAKIAWCSCPACQLACLRETFFRSKIAPLYLHNLTKTLNYPIGHRTFTGCTGQQPPFSK